jgi:hypothetical protein
VEKLLVKVIGSNIIRPANGRRTPPAGPTSASEDSQHPLWESVGQVISIRERNLTMMKKDLLLRNPLHQLGLTSEDSLPDGSFGAVLARAGIGKTAFLVQIALHTMLRDRNILHISLDDPVEKVTLWYREVFNLLAEKRNVQVSAPLWDDLLPRRFIMTFKVEGFSVPKLKERMTDLIEQNIFRPHTLIVDGVPFDNDVRDLIKDLKDLSAATGVRCWFTVRTHRHEAPTPDGMPPQMASLQDLFDVSVQLVPDGEDIHIRILKGLETPPRDTAVRFDPATMLINEPE